jgi:hypothetical protein
MSVRPTPTEAVARVLDRLRNVTNGANCWTSFCPAHDDRTSSLSIGAGDDGRALIKCHAGCTTESVVRAMSLQMSDLFPPNSRHRGVNGEGADIPPVKAATVQQSGCTLAQYAAGKRLPVKFLKALNLREFRYLGAPAIRIPYLDPSGIEVAVRFRTALEKTGDIDRRFRWKSGAKLCLYGLWRLEEARKTG